MYLTPAGDVVRNDEEGGPLRPADRAERDFALARAAERYPELAHLMPARPRTATTCDQCDGRGRVTLAQGKILPWQAEQFMYCRACDSLGWTGSTP
nr:hypothetical protein GCM10020063_046190 [Dactylosporangium thailandense]